VLNIHRDNLLGITFLCPRHSKNGGGALSVTPVRACVCPCVRPSVIKIWCPLNNFWKTASIPFIFGMLIYNIKTQVEFGPQSRAPFNVAMKCCRPSWSSQSIPLLHPSSSVLFLLICLACNSGASNKTGALIAFAFELWLSFSFGEESSYDRMSVNL